MRVTDTEPCPDCDGQGYTEEDEADARGEHCTREVECDRCDGEGQILALHARMALALARVERAEMRGNSADLSHAESEVERLRDEEEERRQRRL